MDLEEFEEIVEPIAPVIETIDYYYIKSDKTRIGNLLKSLSSKYPISEEVVTCLKMLLLA